MGNLRQLLRSEGLTASTEDALRVSGNGRSAGSKTSPFMKVTEKFLGMELTALTDAKKVRISRQGDSLHVTCYSPNVWNDIYEELGAALRRAGVSEDDDDDPRFDEVYDRVMEEVFTREDTKFQRIISDFFGGVTFTNNGGSEGQGGEPSIWYEFKASDVWPR